MKLTWKYFLFLLWLSYLFVCALLLFTRGFLLSRRTLLQKSACVERSDCSKYQKLSRDEPSPENTQDYLECLDKNQLKLRENGENHCLPHEKKVVILIIDAMRYDFASFNKTLKPDERLPFQNRMPIFEELLVQRPNNSLLYKFIANPPTTTLQRLKGLTTGSLPTFIDVGSNFATPEINEDNVLDQLLSRNKTVVFMGDDTWTALYPGRFKRQYAYPSFDVWDLDTVDSGVSSHLKLELSKKDWNLLIAHFLGVDHCGHRYGPYHPEMKRKLEQMNNIVQNAVELIDEDTVLFVMGDHGMTYTGDHGGESSDEITSALFVYSPVPFLPKDVAVKTDSVHQVDIVPTLAALLGFAIPFSNLGKVILSALPINSKSEYHTSQSEIQRVSTVLSINVEQIMLYINTYSRHIHAFSKVKISNLLEKFHSLKLKLNSVNDRESFKLYHTAVIEFLDYVRESCEEIWIQFDSFSMSRGLVLMFLLLSFTFFIIEGIPYSCLNSVLEGGFFLHLAYLTVFSIVAASVSLYHFKVIDDAYLLIYVSTLSISMLLMATVVVRNWGEITLLWFNTYKNRDWSNVIIRFIHLCSLLLLFSNSFIVEEGTVLSFMLNTATWLVAYNISLSNNNNSKTKGKEKGVTWLSKTVHASKLRPFVLTLAFTLLLRMSHYHWRCREEQKWCLATTDSAKQQTRFKFGRGNLDAAVTLAILALFVSLNRIWLRSCGNLVGFSTTVILARYAPSVIVVCIGGFWVLQGLPQESKTKLFLPWQLQILPWTAFALVGITIVSLYLRPLCVYTVRKRGDVVSVYGNENIIPQLFHQVKKIMRVEKENGGGGGGSNRAPLIYGLATAYSAVFLVLGQFACLLVIMLLGDSLASSVVLMFSIIVLLLLILSCARLENTSSPNTGKIFHVPWPYVLIWGLLSSYFFYGTGHQPTFPGIHWYAAFVGTGGKFSSNVLPAILVGFNTFGSHIIAGLLLPMLLISPYTFSVMLPKWMSSTNIISSERNNLKLANKSEATEGDIQLYENEGLTQYALLKLSTKYVLFHGTRIFSCMLAAAVHCRHLMVWMIFTPRFIFEGIGFMVTLVSVLLGYWLFIRVSVAIDHLMNDITKEHNS